MKKFFYIYFFLLFISSFKLSAAVLVEDLPVLDLLGCEIEEEYKIISWDDFTELLQSKKLEELCEGKILRISNLPHIGPEETIEIGPYEGNILIKKTSTHSYGELQDNSWKFELLYSKEYGVFVLQTILSDENVRGRDLMRLVTNLCDMMKVPCVIEAGVESLSKTKQAVNLLENSRHSKIRSDEAVSGKEVPYLKTNR